MSVSVVRDKRVEEGYAPVIDLFIYRSIKLVNLVLELSRKKSTISFIGLAKMLGNQGVKFSVQHADDLAGLVVDNGLCLLVVQHGNGIAAGILGIVVKVELFEIGEAVERVFVEGVMQTGCELPAFFAKADAEDDLGGRKKDQ